MKPVVQYPMLIATLGIMFFSMMDAVMKGQALAMGTYNAMFWRMAMGALIVAVLYLPRRPLPASGRVLKIHLIRAALTAVMAYLFFFGLTRIPLAQAIGLSFIAPIITLFLAVPFWVSASVPTPSSPRCWALAVSAWVLEGVACAPRAVPNEGALEGVAL